LKKSGATIGVAARPGLSRRATLFYRYPASFSLRQIPPNGVPFGTCENKADDSVIVKNIRPAEILCTPVLLSTYALSTMARELNKFRWIVVAEFEKAKRE
jgi:hypothetical protein